MAGPLISVVITTLNEGKHIQDLLESLTVQEGPFEVIVVDAGSTDRTIEVANVFQAEHPGFRVLHFPGKRGASRNFGIQNATGEYIAFTDGDCIANAFWLRNLRKHANPERVVAGRSVQIGYWAFDLGRVGINRRGNDITHPSSNLLYPKAALEHLGGFDPRFVTAEDIDLNFRAVEAGLQMVVEPAAVVYTRARDSIKGFLKQAFWNGYGRKQLTLKHGSLWNEYGFQRMLAGQLHFWGILRLKMGVLGYVNCLLRESKKEWARGPRPMAVKVGA